MAGIYLHVPFCRQACHYCDFHFSTSTLRVDDMVDAMCQELVQRRDYLASQEISSIYFGGGTPSLLDDRHIRRILELIHEQFSVEKNSEITLEANPDDLTKQKINHLAEAGINRLSIGIQSFDDNQLKRMNRAHSALEAEFAVKCAQDRGLENITADLIFALPDLSIDDYKKDLRKLLAMGVQHLSAYGLTIEPKTVFHKWSTTGRLQEANASLFESHFRTTPEIAAEFGLTHYEVSNFGKEGFYSRHNTAYWKGHHYLGIGPSAHSFDGQSRQWNVANNPKYLQAMAAGTIHCEREIIDAKTAYHEYIMTRLRTIWGIDLEKLKANAMWDFGGEQEERIAQWIQKDWARQENQEVILTLEGWLQVDTLTAALFN